MHSLIPLEFSAEELAAKVRDHAVSFGYAAPPADRHYEFEWANAAIDDASKRAKTIEERRQRLQAEPPIQLGYRQSPFALIALPDGENSDWNPSPTVSGMIEAWVNSRGELRSFRAVPPHIDPATAPAEIDTGLLSRAVGFDLAKWTDTAPRFTPLYAFDKLKAWKGRHPKLDFDVTVQAAAWRGRITEVNVIWPWSTTGRMPGAHPEPPGMGTMLERITSTLIFLFSVFLGARNLRAGRGDLRGATRLAITVTLSLAASWLWGAHWAADFGMIKVIQTKAQDWITSGALVWLLYIALEPAVRARWPRSILTWSRVLVGRWRDPLVCGDVLYGALAGTLIMGFFIGLQYFSSRHSGAQPVVSANAGLAAKYWIAGLLHTATNAAEFGLIVVFAIFCFRLIFRRDWLASLAAATLFSLQESEIWRGGYVDFVFFLFVFTALIFVLLRLGLVTTIVAIFVVDMLAQTPAPQDLSKPYEWAVILYPATAVVLAIWAFWRTSKEELLSASSGPAAY